MSPILFMAQRNQHMNFFLTLVFPIKASLRSQGHFYSTNSFILLEVYEHCCGVCSGNMGRGNELKNKTEYMV